MKRTPLKRGGPIRKARTERRPGRASPEEWELIAAAVYERSRGRCEAGERSVCNGRGEHFHHVQLKSRGGPDTVDNLLHVCQGCHGWAHANVAEATERGWISH